LKDMRRSIRGYRISLDMEVLCVSHRFDDENGAPIVGAAWCNAYPFLDRVIGTIASKIKYTI